MVQKIFVESYGCTLSKSETGLYVNKMLSEGGVLVDSPESADISVIGTCVVIKHTEEKMLRRIGELSDHSKVRVMGCLPPISAGSLKDDKIEVIDPLEFRKFYTGKLDEIEIKEPSIFEGIPINQGCTGSCNFCISHIARGKLVSRRPEKIVNQIRMQLERNIREVRITSLDTAAYGKDIESNLAELIRGITNIDGDFMLRVGMMEPRNTHDILGGLLNSLDNKKVFKFMHLPVQSGSNRILSLMNREYQREEFEAIVASFRKRFRDSVLSTDIIAGYHGDDEESFSDTMNLLETTKPDIVNVTRFSPRPFTKDFSVKTPPSDKVKSWTISYAEKHKEILAGNMEKFIGKTRSIMITEKGKEGTSVGRDLAYRPVVVPGVHEIYSRLECEIVGTGNTYLIGKVI